MNARRTQQDGAHEKAQTAVQDAGHETRRRDLSAPLRSLRLAPAQPYGMDMADTIRATNDGLQITERRARGQYVGGQDREGGALRGRRDYDGADSDWEGDARG